MSMTQSGSVLSAADGTTSDLFGSSVAISSNGLVMAVGAIGWEGGTTDQGGVYIYDLTGGAWVQRGSVITEPSAGDSNHFGSSVALSSDGAILAVGASDSLVRGRAYAFTWSGSAWSQRGATIQASDYENYDGFGKGIALSSDGAILVVGAPSWDGTYSNQGAIYTYDWSGSAWTQRAQILSGSAQASAGFGNAVALNGAGTILAVGASSYDYISSNRGAVYIYDISGSTWVARGSLLYAADGAASDAFGTGVALNSAGTTLAVGAPAREASSGTDRGAAYLYVYASSWTETQVIEPSDAADSDAFGTSVALNSDASLLIIGARSWEGGATDQGGVYTYASVPPVTGSVSAPVTMTVTEAVIAPISIVVANPTGTVSTPIEIGVTATGSASASLAMNVVNTLATQTWTVALTLSGVDYSARLSGEVTVDAEEGASRTALFTLLPVAGVVDPFTWLGAAVAISLVRIINSLHIPTRVFTGKVDVARFDPSTGTVTFSCSDDLKNIISNLSVEAIDALTINELGLDYSVGAQGEAPLDRWDYAQARMAAVCGELDAGVYGSLRVTPFAGSTVWGTFTEAGVLYDAAYAIDLPERSDIINQVAVEYEYRRHRCRQRVAYISWANTVIGTDALACGYQSPSTSAVKSALDGCGWELLGWSTSPGWAYVVTPTPPPGKTGSGWYFQGTADACGAMAATVGQRHAQEFTESYQTTITCDQSITTFGVRQKTIRGALSTDWSPNNWETDWTIATPDASLADVDYSGTCTRTQSDEAFKTLCMLAKKEIHASHRTCRVTFSIPALPELDLVHSAMLSTTAIGTSGKVARLVHRFNLDSGAAETDVTLAIMGVAAWGAGSDDSLDNPPPPPTWGSGADDDATWTEDTWQSSIPSLGLHVGSTATAAWSESLAGYLVNAPETLTIVQLDPFTYAVIDSVSVANSYYAAGKAFPQTGFRVSLPGVADNYRNAPPIKTVIDSRTTVVAATNPLTLTIG